VKLIFVFSQKVARKAKRKIPDIAWENKKNQEESAGTAAIMEFFFHVITRGSVTTTEAATDQVKRA